MQCCSCHRKYNDVAINHKSLGGQGPCLGPHCGCVLNICCAAWHVIGTNELLHEQMNI